MARKTTARPAAKTVPAEPVACPVCKGSGQVAVTVRVGRHAAPGRPAGRVLPELLRLRHRPGCLRRRRIPCPVHFARTPFSFRP